jgi:LysM repeat protein
MKCFLQRRWRWTWRGGLGLCLLLWGAIGCTGRVITGPTPTAASLAISLATPTVLPTLVPQVLTPAPTNTPAPTPTPIIHVVQPGDTLLGIALQYNVTLEELYQVNGVLKPELLQIGQSIVIPVPGSVGKPAGDSSGAVIAPTAPPLPVKVENAARFQTPVGSMWILGEVFNPTDQPVENVQVRVALLDATGHEVASDTPFVALDTVPPGGRAPFSVLFGSPPNGVIDFQAYVVRADQAYSYGSRYAQLQVTDVQTRTVGTQYGVSGKVSNTGTSNAVGASLVITLYDAKGRVTGFRQFTLPDDQLAAGGSTTFDEVVAPDPSAPAVASSSVVAEARTR